MILPDVAMVRRENVVLAPFRRFRPSLVLGYQQDLHALTGRLADLPAADAYGLLTEAVEAVDRHIADLRAVGLTSGDLAPTTRYATTLRVLRDLLLQGWTVRDDDEGVILDAPGRPSVAIEDPERAKEALRRAFSFAREAQLRQDSTRRFMETMERRGIETLFYLPSPYRDRPTQPAVVLQRRLANMGRPAHEPSRYGSELRVSRRNRPVRLPAHPTA